MKSDKLLRKTIRTILTEDLFSTDNKLKPHEKLLVNAVVNFMKDELNFDAKITVRKMSSVDFYGDISLNDNSVNHNKFTLHVTDGAYNVMIQSMIHELTHIKQVSKGELKPSPSYDAIIWKDSFTMTVKQYNKLLKSGTVQYQELPWEVEANKNMNDTSLINRLMKSKYITSLKGKDSTLDFILNNL